MEVAITSHVRLFIVELSCDVHHRQVHRNVCTKICGTNGENRETNEEIQQYFTYPTGFIKQFSEKNIIVSDNDCSGCVTKNSWFI